MTSLTPAEFRGWLDNCLRDARLKGLSDTEIYLEVLNLVKFLTVKIMLQAASKKIEPAS